MCQLKLLLSVLLTFSWIRLSVKELCNACKRSDRQHSHSSQQQLLKNMRKSAHGHSVLLPVVPIYYPSRWNPIWLPNSNPLPHLTSPPNPKPTNPRGVIIWQGSELDTTPARFSAVNVMWLWQLAFTTG